MDLIDLLVTDPSSLEKVVETISPQQLGDSIAKLSLDQIPIVIRLLARGFHALAKKKTRAVILGLNDRKQLEAAARGFSLEQFRFLVDALLQAEEKHHWKLAPLLIGISQDLFSQFLFMATEQQLHFLQHEGVTEPVQHQLTLLSHDFARQIQKMEQEIDLFCEDLQKLDPEILDKTSTEELYFKIDLFASCFEKLFQQINKALAIAWNTDRLDLIEAFNRSKETCQKYNLYGIGGRRNRKAAPTGLYAELEELLFNKFGEEGAEALPDTDPAIEGLAKLSLWDLPDYWEVGLLPKIKNIKNLDLQSQEYTNGQRNIVQKRFQKEVQENLEKLGLSTISDLKLARIFSKKTLKDYIETHSPADR